MKNYIEKEVKQSILKSITCDVCFKEFDNIFDIQEFHHICFIGGYTSVFGDSNKVTSDICQGCLKDKLGNYLTIRPTREF